MKLNCKPGDLALIVKSRAGNVGRFVTVTFYEHGVRLCDGSFCDGWRFDGPAMNGMHGMRATLIPDSFLRPIRDQDGEDEMIRIAGLSNKEPSNV